MSSSFSMVKYRAISLANILTRGGPHQVDHLYRPRTEPTMLVVDLAKNASERDRSETYHLS